MNWSFIAFLSASAIVRLGHVRKPYIQKPSSVKSQVSFHSRLQGCLVIYPWKQTLECYSWCRLQIQRLQPKICSVDLREPSLIQLTPREFYSSAPQYSSVQVSRAQPAHDGSLLIPTSSQISDKHFPPSLLRNEATFCQLSFATHLSNNLNLSGTSPPLLRK